jgi:hypothetical protein
MTLIMRRAMLKREKYQHSNLEPIPIPLTEEQPDSGITILGGIASSVPQTSNAADDELLELQLSW